MSGPGSWFFTDSPYAGGAERYLEYLLQSRPVGELGVIAVERAGLVPWLSAREAEGVPVHRLPPGGRLQEWARLFAACRALRPGTLHCNLPGPYDSLLAFAPRVARLAGVPRIVVTEHLPTVGRVGRRWWAKRAALGAVDRAICVCEAHRPAMRALGYHPGQVLAVRNGIPDPDPQRSSRAGQRRAWPADLRRHERGGLQVLQVGSLEARKGVDVLLRALGRMLGAGVAAQLWLVGDGPDRASLAALARQLGVAHRVVFTGRRDDIPALWAAADVAVLASWREGLPLSLAEAAGCSRPIVATGVDGVVEVVEPGQNGWLVDPGDAMALATALGSLAKDPARRAGMGLRSRQLFELRFGLARMQEATLATHHDAGRR